VRPEDQGKKPKEHGRERDTHNRRHYKSS
jgi:hypothetical protein